MVGQEGRYALWPRPQCGHTRAVGTLALGLKVKERERERDKDEVPARSLESRAEGAWAPAASSAKASRHQNEAERLL